MKKSETRVCRICKSKFVIEPDDFSFYEKMNALPPDLCPECRTKRRLLWRNERTLYKRTCDLCGASIVSIYHPRYSFPVYCFKCHYSDEWDPYAYGVAYDPERPFFEQFAKLLQRVPRAATHVGTGGDQNVNSEYVNFAGGNKNCYLLFNSTQNEDCFYSRGILRSRSSLDLYFSEQAERCYEGVNVNKSSGVFWGQNVLDSMDSYFLLNCSGVQNCFGCVNLRHKSYYFFNEPLPEEEWKKRVGETMGSYEKVEETKKKFEAFAAKFPRKENNNLKTVSSFGDYLFESKNCYACYEAFGCEDVKYAFSVKLLKDAYDVTGRGIKSELLLETVAVGHGCSRVIGSWSAETSHDIDYSYDLRSSSYCIGCIGLKHGEYSILNKRYPEEEYWSIREQIVKELKEKGVYGHYLPPELSPWAYNETLAQENYPLTKEQAIAEGFRWEKEIPKTKGKETLAPEQIPDHIKDVQDSLARETLRCGSCDFNYKVIPSELAFYRQLNLPIPRQCFNCRFLDRIRKRGSFELHERKCDKCGRTIQTTYPPETPLTIYCEQCYQAEVV